MYLNFKHTRNNGDATSNYNVEFESGLTIRKLVDIVLRHSPNEWGCITLTAEGCDRTDIIEYRNGQIVKQNPLFDKVADAEIGELKAQGGYSLMNYHAILTANKTEQRQPLRVCKCKSCGADIVWIKTTNGKSMPCDATAVEYQNNDRGKDTIVLENGEVIKASVVKTGGLLTPIVDGTGYVSHFATCPFAKYHRGRGCAAGGGS